METYEQTNLFGEVNGLKPCPHCGGKAEYSRFFNPKNFFAISCTVCGCGTDGWKLNRANGTDKENMEINAAVWNRRVGEE